MIESPSPNVARRCWRGFTLVEMAIVMIIVSLLIGGMFMSLTASQDLARQKETQKQLASINDALLGFAAANGRLPCPATPGTTGVEDPVGGGSCASPYTGFVPAITLGLTPTNAQGYAIDAWGNPIRYAVTRWDKTVGSNAFTTAGALKAAWASDPSTIKPDLNVCSTASGIKNPNLDTATCNTAPDTTLTNSAVAVIFSTGQNGAATPTSADELANWTNSSDPVFVSHTPTPDFDDIVIWLSPNILYNRLISAGRLP